MKTPKSAGYASLTRPTRYELTRRTVVRANPPYRGTSLRDIALLYDLWIKYFVVYNT